jgi:hypothetical protein
LNDDERLSVENLVAELRGGRFGNRFGEEADERFFVRIARQRLAIDADANTRAATLTPAPPWFTRTPGAATSTAAANAHALREH